MFNNNQNYPSFILQQVNLQVNNLICWTQENSMIFGNFSRGVRVISPCVLSVKALSIPRQVSKHSHYALYSHSTPTLQSCQSYRFAAETDKPWTKEEAVEFLQNSWEFENVELQLQKCRETFLNQLIAAMSERVPFHLLDLIQIMSRPPEEQIHPTFAEMDEMCMSGAGGGCLIKSAFMSRLLNALGYSAYPCYSTITRAVFFPHLIVIIKNLVNHGDIHLVDPGTRFPSFQAVSLNFERESPVYRHSYLEYKMIKQDGKFYRMHGDGDFIKQDLARDGVDLFLGKWWRLYEFTLEDVERDDPTYVNDKIVNIPKGLAPRAARFRGGKAVMIYGAHLYLEQEDSNFKKIKLESKEEVVEAYQKYFPSIKEELVRDVYIEERVTDSS